MYSMNSDSGEQNAGIYPTVSVVVPTFNRGARLSRCLDSLVNQTYPKDRYNIIIVNDGSHDTTEDVLREYEKKATCGFIWITQENQGIAGATNTGIARSNADVICFTGDDCIAESDWITHLIRGFTDDSVGAVGGRIESYQPLTSLQRYVEDSGILNQKRFMLHNKLLSGNAAYRRRILADIHGFDNLLVACVDADVSIKTQLLGYKLQYVPDAVVYHDHPDTLKGLWYRSFRNGKGLVQLHKKYGIHYNLAYNTTIFLFRIIRTVVLYPFTLASAVLSGKERYLMIRPFFEIIRSVGLTLGIVRETLWGEEYKGDIISSRVDFIEFLEDKPLFSLWEKVRKKITRSY